MSDTIYEPRADEEEYDDKELDPYLLDNYEAMNEGRDRPLDLRERMMENEDPGSLEEEAEIEALQELEEDDES